MIKQKKIAKYLDRPAHPHIVDKYEGELKDEFGKMLVKMSKQFGQKLNQILK